jgi:hypothetical protein
MRHDPLFLLWSIDCPSAEDCSGLQRRLPGALTPEAIFVQEVRAFPGGVESHSREPHRLGDYFDSVQVFPSAEERPTSFRLLFRRSPTAQRYWKDLMVRILHKVREEAPQTTTTLEYRGDELPEFLPTGK